MSKIKKEIDTKLVKSVNKNVRSSTKKLNPILKSVVGKRVGEAIRKSGIPRDEIFVVTKLRRVHATGFDETIIQCKESLERLGLDYVDLYLVHAPPENISVRGEVWKAMEECLKLGLTRSIGVSNYGIKHLEDMKNYAVINVTPNKAI